MNHKEAKVKLTVGFQQHTSVSVVLPEMLRKLDFAFVDDGRGGGTAILLILAGSEWSQTHWSSNSLVPHPPVEIQNLYWFQTAGLLVA